jgi:hypothetical protein
MKLAILALAAVAIGLGGAQRSDARAAAKPRPTVAAGTTIHVVGTAIECRVPAGGKLIECYRLALGGGKPVPVAGGYAISIKADGGAVVTRLAGSSWSFVFGRGLAGVGLQPSVVEVRAGDEFRVPGSRIVCTIAPDASRQPAVEAIRCGLADAGGSLRAPRTLAATLSETGEATVVRFDARRRPVELYSSLRGSTAGTLRLSTSTNVYVQYDPQGSSLTCGGILFLGDKAMSCSRFSEDGPENGFSFAVVDDGRIVVFRVSGDLQSAAFVVDGPRSARSASGEKPTLGDTFYAATGQYFTLAGTPVLCLVTGSRGTTAVSCGIADREGLGAPGTHTVALRASGDVVVTRYDERRSGRVVYRSGP